MPIVFAAITPHPPLLIPDIGKEQLSKLQKTQQALNKLEEELYISKPQVIFIISPHSGLFEKSFSINAHTHFTSSFEEFGDLATKQEWIGTPEMAARVKEYARTNNLPLQLVSREKLDHGAAVPLFYLTKHLKDCRIMPIGYSHMDAREHVRFGRLLKETIMNGNKRIAIIASGDLSHGLDKKIWPMNNFDKKLIKLIKMRDKEKILKLDQTKELIDSKECGYRSLLILLGILNGTNYNFVAHSYEHPFGVGYLTGNFYF